MQIGFYYDQSRCMGCYACVAACRSWHELDIEMPDLIKLTAHESGDFPTVYLNHLVTPCLHCAEPRCAWVCPAQAITKKEDGVVIADGEKCRTASRCGIIDEASIPGYNYGDTDSPCQLTCPAHLHIPGYLALIAQGKFKEALNLIRENMPLPSACGRICTAPCETECRRQGKDEPVAIAALKRFVTDYVTEELPQPLPRTKEEKIAIAGSGPAGLAAAAELVKKGYGVTVFEAAPVIGGWLAMGIPSYRLPREVLKRDIDYIKALGVEIKTKTTIGATLTIDDLFKRGYSAVLLAMGTQKGLSLNIPGAELRGTLVGTSFLRDFNLGKRVKVGKRVVVIGGGNVAIESARTARRLGAAEVHVACPESRRIMPATLSEVTDAEEEGIVIHPSMTAVRISGSGGRVTGVEFLKCRAVKFDRDGQPNIKTVENSEQTMPADTVIFAVGQAPDISEVTASGTIKTEKRGTITADPFTLAASRSGVFAAGDVIRGPANFVQAVADGQKAARSINRYLQKCDFLPGDTASIKASDIEVFIPADVVKQERKKMLSMPAPERLKSFREVTRSFSPEMAVAEAKRCLNCAGHLCKNVCPYDVPQFTTGGRIHIVKCDLCSDRLAEGRQPSCVGACPNEALDAGRMEELVSKYGELRSVEGFNDYGQTKPSIVFKARKRIAAEGLEAERK